MKCLVKSAGRDRSIKPSFYFLLLLAAEISFGQEPTFRSQSNVVIVPALVRDAAGHVIYGLHAADFAIDDNGVEQTAQLDQAADTEPLSLMVAIQTGRRAGREFERVQGLSSMLTPILEQPGTQIAVLTFDSQLTLAKDFTDSGPQIASCLHNLEPGDGGSAILTRCSTESGC